MQELKITVDAYDAWGYYLSNKSELFGTKHIIASGENSDGEVGEICITDSGEIFPSMNVTFEVDDKVLEEEKVSDENEAIDKINEMITNLEFWEIGEYPEEEDAGEDRAFEIYEATEPYLEVLLDIDIPTGTLNDFMEEQEVLNLMKGFIRVVNELGYADDEEISDPVEEEAQHG